MAAAIAAIASTAVLTVLELVSSGSLYALPLYLLISGMMAAFAWPFCCFALAFGQSLAQRPSFHWLWNPPAATMAGALSGLILGLPLTLAIGATWWIGAIYGSLSALALTLLAKSWAART